MMTCLNTPNRRTTLKLLSTGSLGLFTPFLGIGNAKASTYKNVSYGPHRLDIYTPQGANDAPVVAYVHGGAWKSGSRRKVGSKANHFIKKGMVFVSIGYTLYPRANAEQQAVQIATAVNWIKDNIAPYGGSSQRIALMGHSAGCHLSALASLSGACEPQLLICNDTGAYDLPFLAKLNNGRIPILYSALNKKSKWVRWSPISYVANRQQPPTLVMWSGGRNRDRISKRFATALEEVGASVTRFDGKKYNHLTINSRLGKNNPATLSVDNFLQEL